MSAEVWLVICVAVAAGGYFLGEVLTPMRLLGAFCIMLGIFFIAQS